MSTLRTRTDLTAHDIRRLKRHGYEIVAIETDHRAERDRHTIVWAREINVLIPDHELPFYYGYRLCNIDYKIALNLSHLLCAQSRSAAAKRIAGPNDVARDEK